MPNNLENSDQTGWSGGQRAFAEFEYIGWSKAWSAMTVAKTHFQPAPDAQ